MKFKVRFEKEWTEPGEAIIEAEDEDEAHDIAAEMLSTDDPDIEWASSNMDPGRQSVESVEEIEGEDQP